MCGQPARCGGYARIGKANASSHQRKNAVGRGCPVTAVVLAVVPGLVCVELGSRKEEAAVQIIGPLAVVVLAAFDEDTRRLQCRIAGGNARCAERLNHITRHRQVDVARIRWSATSPAHAPRAIRGVLGVPTVLLSELLRAEVRDHRRHRSLKTRAMRCHDGTHRQRSRVVWIVWNRWIGHAQRAIFIRLIANECEGLVDFRGRRRIVVDNKQSAQHKGRQRLSRPQQTVGAAVPSAVLGLLLPQECRRAAKRGFRFWLRFATRSQKGDHY